MQVRSCHRPFQDRPGSLVLVITSVEAIMVTPDPLPRHRGASLFECSCGNTLRRGPNRPGVADEHAT